MRGDNAGRGGCSVDRSARIKFPCPAYRQLFDSNALGEISRFVDIGALDQCSMIRKQLNRNSMYNG